MRDNAGLYVLSLTHRVTVTMPCLWKQIASFCIEVFSIPVPSALIPVFLTGIYFTPGPATVSHIYWSALAEEDRWRPCYIL